MVNLMKVFLTFNEVRFRFEFLQRVKPIRLFRKKNIIDAIVIL